MALAERLQGVSGVLVAPLDEAGVNARAAREIASRCDRAGIHTLTALGNTAEVYQLTSTERLELVEAVAEARVDAALVCGLAGPRGELLDMANRAEALGYDAVMVHEPVDPFASDEGIRALLLALADSLPLPVVLYLRTLRLSLRSIAALIEHPRVIALKWARPDTSGATSLLLAGGAESCVWICGLAESMVPTFAALGVTGFTSGLANVQPELALEIWAAARGGDSAALARSVRKALRFELLRNADGGRLNVAVVKAALRLRGLEVGDVRPPCTPLALSDVNQVREILTDWAAGA